MSRKIGVIVEGPIDKDFFDKYFKKQFPDFRGIKVVSSGTARNQKIKSKTKLKTRIKDLKDKNDCNEIYVLIDLDEHQCVKKLRDNFKSDMGLLDEIPVIVSTELESWMYSAWEKSDKKTKEDLKRRFNIKSDKNLEENILKKFLKENIDIKHENNESLCYFLKKLGLVEKCK